jgi:cobalt-precorrin 5A hydrolase
MALEEAMIALAVGVGCRRGADAQAIVALVRRALERCEESAKPKSLFAMAGKETQVALYEAAAALGLPLVFLPREKLIARSDEAVTRSERVIALFGVPSVAETAALAGAGANAKLVVPRMAAGGVTCAIARAEESKR